MRQYPRDVRDDLRAQLRKRKSATSRIVGTSLHVAIIEPATWTAPRRSFASSTGRSAAAARPADEPAHRSTRAIRRPAGFNVRLTEAAIASARTSRFSRTRVTLRNRVNELGVAEAVVQRQGLDRILVELPGIQDPATAKRVLGSTATLEFHLVDQENDPPEAQRRGRAPLGSELHRTARTAADPAAARRHRLRRSARRRQPGYRTGRPS